ncbi:HTH-type transcriptional regulator BhcR [Stappia sp.]|uniref:HTH-type transcriptional regulator BhcR n=1 Tax=Stappia sp. TaxID=1870903 RepID=UPI003A9A0239
MAEIQRRKGRPKAFDDKGAHSVIQSLDRALVVLDLLARHDGLSLSEIAEELDQSPATIYRVLSTLAARSIVESDAATQAWHIGPMAFRLGSAFLRRSSVIERSRPVMRKLMEDTRETSNLGIEKDGEVMFISQVESHEAIRAFFRPGTLSPLHASGIGKALMSQFSDARLDAYLAGAPLQQFTGRTIIAPDALRSDLTRARDLGYAVDDEEKTEGMRCIAAPVHDLYGETVAGISVSGPANRLTRERIEEVGRLVRDAATSLSEGRDPARAPPRD